MKTRKPHKDFPLFLHRTGQWAKKVRGRTHYFGTDADAALARWLDERDDLLAGRTPGLHLQGITARELANRFLTAKKSLQDSGELSPRTWADYYRTCETLIDHFGKSRRVQDLSPIDFEGFRTALAKTRGPVALGNEVQRVRTVFAFAWAECLIDKPVRFGGQFKKPSRKAMRKARAQTGSRMLEPEELRSLLASADPAMKAMILLGLNCGFGQTDVANLPIRAVDLTRGWIDYPREKTAIDRRCPLWPETVAAIRAAIERRPAPKSEADAGMVFITKYGHRWVRTRIREEGKPEVVIDSIQLQFQKLLRGLELHRAGIGFYCLRHIFRTVADGARDQVAADFIMGHVPQTMAAHYRERIDDSRLVGVVNAVRAWLW